VMLIPLGVLAVGAILAGMIWYKPFFGHTDSVAKFFGVPYEEVHSEDGAADEGDHHYVFAGQPGQGAIHVGPDNHVLDEAHAVPVWVKLSPFVAMLIGLATAWTMYIRQPDLPGRVAAANRPLYDFLLNKWYFDELYDAVLVRPAQAIGRFLWKGGDGKVIDGAINGVSMGIVPMVTRALGRAQSGYIFTYAFFMVIGIAALITWVVLAGGAQ